MLVLLLKSNVLEMLNNFRLSPERAAMIAPTIITDEIALVTDIMEYVKMA